MIRVIAVTLAGVAIYGISLGLTIAGLLRVFNVTPLFRPLALFSPHAGYMLLSVGLVLLLSFIALVIGYSGPHI